MTNKTKQARIYRGEPIKDGKPAKITVQAGKGKPKPLAFPSKAAAAIAAWGPMMPRGPAPAPGARGLAHAILLDLLGSDTDAKALAARFMWRVLFPLKAYEPFELHGDQLIAHVTAIREVEVTTAPGVRIAATEVMAPLPGGALGDVQWSKDPKLTPNMPEKEK